MVFGFRVSDWGFRVWGLGFGVWDFGFGVWGLGFGAGVQDLGLFGALGQESLGSRVQGLLSLWSTSTLRLSPKPLSSPYPTVLCHISMK